MKIEDLFVEFIEALDGELELLATIRYRLTVLGALAEADQGQSLEIAVREMEASCDSLRISELLRSSITVQLAEELELDPFPKMEEIAVRAPDAWGEVLLERRLSLLQAVAGIRGLAASVTGSLGRKAVLVDQALTFLRSDTGVTYGRPAQRGGVIVEGSI